MGAVNYPAASGWGILPEKMKLIIKKANFENEKRFHTDFEVSQQCIEKISEIAGIETVVERLRYSFKVWIGKCFEWDVIEPKIKKVLKKYSAKTSLKRVLGIPEREKERSNRAPWIGHIGE